MLPTSRARSLSLCIARSPRSCLLVGSVSRGRGARARPQLFEKIGREAKPGDEYGSKRDYACDLIPKFVMAKGLLVKILLHTRTTHYLDFAKVEGSYVMAKGVVNKVPATAQEALNSNLMGMFEKRRMKKLLDYAFTYDPADAGTHGGKDMKALTTQAVFDSYSLDPGNEYLLITQEPGWRALKAFTDISEADATAAFKRACGL